MIRVFPKFDTHMSKIFLVRQSGFNVKLAFASAGRASAHSSTGSLKWMSDFSIPCLRVAYRVNSHVYSLSNTE